MIIQVDYQSGQVLQRELAEEFGVAAAYISQICSSSPVYVPPANRNPVDEMKFDPRLTSTELADVLGTSREHAAYLLAVGLLERRRAKLAAEYATGFRFDEKARACYEEFTKDYFEDHGMRAVYDSIGDT